MPTKPRGDAPSGIAAPRQHIGAVYIEGTAAGAQRSMLGVAVLAALHGAAHAGGDLHVGKATNPAAAPAISVEDPRIVSIDARWPQPALSDSTPVRAFGGGRCYLGDNVPHRLVVDVTISTAAEALAGSRQAALRSIQLQFARASEVMLVQFHVWLEMGSVLWGQTTLCQSQDLLHFASGATGVFQHLFDFCPNASYGGLAYVNVSCHRLSRGMTMLDAGWTIFLHELGHNLGALHDTSHNGLMQYGGVHAHFAAPESRETICAGLELARLCGGAAAAACSKLRRVRCRRDGRVRFDGVGGLLDFLLAVAGNPLSDLPALLTTLAVNKIVLAIGGAGLFSPFPGARPLFLGQNNQKV